MPQTLLDLKRPELSENVPVSRQTSDKDEKHQFRVKKQACFSTPTRVTSSPHPSNLFIEAQSVPFNSKPFLPASERHCFRYQSHPHPSCKLEQALYTHHRRPLRNGPKGTIRRHPRPKPQARRIANAHTRRKLHARRLRSQIHGKRTTIDPRHALPAGGTVWTPKPHIRTVRKTRPHLHPP